MAEKIESVKFNVSLKKQLFDKIEDYADDLGLSRSAFIAFCCSQYIKSQEALEHMEQLKDLMKEVALKKDLTEEDKKKIDDFEVVCRCLGCDID